MFRNKNAYYTPGPISTGMGDRVRGSTAGAGKSISVPVYNRPPRSTQPGIPPWGGTMRTSQTAVMLCGCGLTAGMVRKWVAGKTV